MFRFALPVCLNHSYWQVLFNLFVAILIMGVSEEKSKAFKGQEEEVMEKS